MAKHPDERTQAAANAVVERITLLQQSIDSGVHAFVARCREERKAKRKELTLESPGSGRHRFSPYVLSYRVNRGYAELYWSEIYYVKGSKTPRFRRVPVGDGATHLGKILVGAHEGEADLIRSHEAQARVYRKLWSTFVVARREMDKCVVAAGKVVALESDPMVIASR